MNFLISYTVSDVRFFGRFRWISAVLQTLKRTCLALFSVTNSYSNIVSGFFWMSTIFPIKNTHSAWLIVSFLRH